MLAGMLLHMVKPPCSVNCSADFSSRSNGLSSKVQNAAIHVISYLADRDFFPIHQHHALIKNLSTAGGIECCLVEHYSMAAIALQRFDHSRIKAVKERVVIVETIGHCFLNLE